MIPYLSQTVPDDSLDRAFVATDGNLIHKIGAAVVTTFNQLNNYINYDEMLIPSTNYQNVMHATVPGEATEDYEGR